jgi:hypothetical protein
MDGESYKNRRFKVVDPDARLRRAGDLMAFEVDAAGAFKTIAIGSVIRVDRVESLPMGAKGQILFARALAEDGSVIGWTSTRNLEGKFVNETLGEILPAPGANRYGPNAAWSHGAFLGQKTLVSIVDATLEIERIALDTLAPYQDLCAAAATDGVEVAIKSGFRSYPEQMALYDGYVRHLPGFNLAAKPGTSNHQSGIAFDISVAGGNGNPTYEWLKKNAPARGFVRTVKGEPWHWEYDQAKAAAAVASGTYKTPNVTV